MPALLRRRDDRGSVTLQIIPLLMVFVGVLFAGVQAAMIWQTRAVVLAAAQQGARIAALEGSTSKAGMAAAREYAAGDSNATSITATGSRSAQTATITVAADAISLVPSWNPRVTMTATMPVERLTR